MQTSIERFYGRLQGNRAAAFLRRSAFVAILIPALLSASCSSQSTTKMNSKSTNETSGVPEAYSAHLNDAEYDVLVNKGTDRPGDGGYTNLFDQGVYHCRACGTALYKSETKFHSGCGWPSFETEIPGTVKRNVDRAYGMVRTEIVCATCGGHLGHEFQGERITPANNRHCVNTSSIVFHPADTRVYYLMDDNVDDLQYSLYNKRGVLFTRIGELEPQASAGSGTGTNNATPVKAMEIHIDPSVVSIESLVESLRSSSATGGAHAAQSTGAFHAYAPERQHTKLRQARAGNAR
jgi:methionine-R-sulfoxide reductase